MHCQEAKDSTRPLIFSIHLHIGNLSGPDLSLRFLINVLSEHPMTNKPHGYIKVDYKTKTATAVH